MLLSPAALEIESERVKQLEKGLDQQALELTEHGEETGAEGEVGLVLPIDLTEPNNERSLLYTNTSGAQSKAQTVINASAGTPAVGVTTQLSHSQDSSPEVLLQNSVESRYVLLLACFFDLPYVYCTFMILASCVQVDPMRLFAYNFISFNKQTIFIIL